MGGGQKAFGHTEFAVSVSAVDRIPGKESEAQGRRKHSQQGHGVGE